MNNELARYLAVIAVALGLGCGAGCKKKAGTAAEPVQTESRLPEATNVIAALNQKDYAGAMANLMNAKASVKTEQQQMDFMVLAREVRGKLVQASESDPKAAEALNALRLIIGGR